MRKEGMEKWAVGRAAAALHVLRGARCGLHGHSLEKSSYCHCPSFPRTQQSTDNSWRGILTGESSCTHHTRPDNQPRHEHSSRPVTALHLDLGPGCGDGCDKGSP